MDVTPPLSCKPAYPLSAFIAVKIFKALCQIEFLSSIHFFPSLSLPWYLVKSNMLMYATFYQLLSLEALRRARDGEAITTWVLKGVS